MSDSAGLALPWRHSGAAWWRDARAYAELAKCDQTAFAWEWLRRSYGYRQAWHHWHTRTSANRPEPQAFGLERFEDPERATPFARTLWCAWVDPMVIRASVLDPLATVTDRIDLRILSPLVSLAIDEQQIEHLLLSDGSHSLRIDILEGTLIGCPSSLRFALEGVAQLRGSMTALDRLLGLIERGRFAEIPASATGRRQRWIAELRVADALAVGATTQDIARVLFAGTIADTRWRVQNSAYRLRVQRLVKGARKNLEEPLHRRWFYPASLMPDQANGRTKP